LSRLLVGGVDTGYRFLYGRAMREMIDFFAGALLFFHFAVFVCRLGFFFVLWKANAKEKKE
jgi:hypothetical protein